MHFESVAIESLDYVLFPEAVLSSDALEAELAEVYQRLKLPAGRLELMTGIRERCFWPSEFKASEASALAGERRLLNFKVRTLIGIQSIY